MRTHHRGERTYYPASLMRSTLITQRIVMLLACTAAAITGLAACGDSDEQSMCVVFADFEAARAEVQAVDPESVAAAGAIDAIQEYYDTIRQLRETTDGRYSAAVDDLDVAVADALRTLESVDADADYTTWSPLVEDEFQVAREAADKVEELINPQCNPDQDEEQ